ncbi:hypothetical protein K474DRAFT_1641695 [Panus rudis PR-1116 ss-1]|nr:hypothetical protein K474DRAFT_1641695 [Panus rudis PR-1116 ss-1]
MAVAVGNTASSLLSPTSFFHATSCDIKQQVSSLVLPPNQNQLFVEANLDLNFVGLAFGVQNYTCTQAGNFTSAGAVAELIDVSCLTGSSIFHSLPDQTYNLWTNKDFDSTSVQDIISSFHMSNPPEILAQHYFITNPTTGQGLSPVWDFRSSGKFSAGGGASRTAFVVAKGKGSLPAPTDPKKDINWLQVENIGGDAGGNVAQVVYRTDTRGGQPPDSCQFGSSLDVSIKYVSFYCKHILSHPLTTSVSHSL